MANNSELQNHSYFLIVSLFENTYPLERSWICLSTTNQPKPCLAVTVCPCLVMITVKRYVLWWNHFFLFVGNVGNSNFYRSYWDCTAGTALFWDVYKRRWQDILRFRQKTLFYSLWNMFHPQTATGGSKFGCGRETWSLTTIPVSPSLSIPGQMLLVAASIPIKWTQLWNIIYFNRWFRPSQVCSASTSGSQSQCRSVFGMI